MSNELILHQAVSDIVVTDPITGAKVSATDFTSLIDSANKRVSDLQAAVEKLGDLATASVVDMRGIMHAIEETDDAIKGWPDSYAQAVMRATGVEEGLHAYRVQTHGTGVRIDALSVRGKMRAIKAKLADAIANREPPAPKHTYVAQFECTDADLKKIVAAIGKATEKWRVCAPQGDKACAAIDKWFESNM